jgi:lipopolysaccharide transport system ATP-binding protein
MGETAILLKGVSKRFKRYGGNRDRLLDLILPGKVKVDEFLALKEINLEVQKGQTVGIVGQNGSGKSTLLQIISGILTPNTGEVKINGRIAALLELGSGFNLEFTGRQNIFFNGKILGLKHKEVEEKFDDIERFADIGDFIDQPVRTYSSGMFVRLAFAVASSLDPDILIVDEALAVGDEAFQYKCYGKIKVMQEMGKTILFVSHSSSSIVELCDSAILIDRGEILLSGLPKKVTTMHHRLLYAPSEKRSGLRAEIQDLSKKADSSTKINTESEKFLESLPQELSDDFFDPELLQENVIEYINCGAKIKNPHITTLNGRKVNVLKKSEEYIYKYAVEFTEAPHNVKAGMLIKTISGLELGGISSALGENFANCVRKGETIQVEFRFYCSLQPGLYLLNAGVTGRVDSSFGYLDRKIDAVMFRVQHIDNNFGTGIVDFQIQSKIYL